MDIIASEAYISTGSANVPMSFELFFSILLYLLEIIIAVQIPHRKVGSVFGIG